MSTVPATRPRRRRTWRRVRRGGWNLLGIALFAVMVFPVFWMVSTALKPDDEINSSTPTWFSLAPTLQHFRDAMARPYFWDTVQNSLIVVSVTVAASIALAFLAAVALAKYRFTGRKAFVVLMIGILMLPPAGLVIPLYVVLARYHLTNALTGVILTYLTFVLPFAVWTLRGFILGIPAELEEAAMVDGSSRLGAFVRILLPLVAPGLVATSVFAFITTWNEYIFASVLLSDQSNHTVTVWLSYFYGTSRNTDWGGLMAASTLTAIPVIVFFLLVQRRIMFGLTAGADRAPSFPPLIPKPLAVAPERGVFELARDARIVVLDPAPEAAGVARLLAARLRPATGYALPVSRVPRRIREGSIVLALAPGDRSLGDEGYRLRVDAERVTISARRPTGLFRGAQTLRQLLPPAIEADTAGSGPWLVGRGTIHDRPRFGWRGLMLDVARHFFDVDEVLRLIDELAAYKLNVLHLHLTDDQGWRIAVRSWPNLTRVGGRGAVGGAPGGHYTQRQYARIVAYARQRYVEVVPEIDMPGHVNAALASYGELTSDGVAPAPYAGIEVGFSSLAIRNEQTYAFVDDVVREVAALTPGPYLHIGGDEALSTDAADYRYFVERVQRIVRARGKRMVGWEETARTRLRRTAVAQHWHDPALALRAVEQGAKLVLSPATRTYLDMKYAPSSPLGLAWAGTTSVREAYDWDPATLIEGVGAADVLGLEAALWSETIEDRRGLDYLAFPRLLGLAEIAWSPAAGRTWREYRGRLAAHGARLGARRIGFHEAPDVPWN